MIDHYRTTIDVCWECYSQRKTGIVVRFSRRVTAPNTFCTYILNKPKVELCSQCLEKIIVRLFDQLEDGTSPVRISGQCKCWSCGKHPTIFMVEFDLRHNYSSVVKIMSIFRHFVSLCKECAEWMTDAIAHEQSKDYHENKRTVK